MPDRTVYYPVWVSNHAGRRSPYCWGPPCDTPAEATHAGQAELEAGNATLSFVVRVDPDGTRTPLPGCTRPQAAKRVVLHWELLWDAAEGPA